MAKRPVQSSITRQLSRRFGKKSSAWGRFRMSMGEQGRSLIAEQGTGKSLILQTIAWAAHLIDDGLIGVLSS